MPCFSRFYKYEVVDKLNQTRLTKGYSVQVAVDVQNGEIIANAIQQHNGRMQSAPTSFLIVGSGLSKWNTNLSLYS